MSTCYEKLLRGVNRKGFVVYFNHKIPMRRFLQDIENLACAFGSLHLNKGDVVTLYLPSCLQSLAAFYACSKLGLVANIVHPQVPLDLLRKNLCEVCSKALFFYDGLIRDERPLAGLSQILVRCSVADYVSFRKPAFAFYSRFLRRNLRGRKNVHTYRQICSQKGETDVVGRGSDVVCYMHSGGTSGEPKIVALTNDAFNSTCDSMQKMYRPQVSEGDFNLATLPIFHAYGLCAAMHTPLCLGCSIILVPRFRPKIVKNYFRHFKITIWSVVPAMIKKMDSADCLDGKWLRNLDVIWCGGDVLDESLVERTNKILSKYTRRARLMRGYGLTETCGVCAVNSFFFYKEGSCGKPMPDCFVQILDDDNTSLASGALGEIAVSAGGNMTGYLSEEMPQTSAANKFCDDIPAKNNLLSVPVGFSRDCFVELQGKSWVKTGDIGYVDDDGFLFVVDRKKRSFKIAAVNVFPAQIEACVKTLPFVDEACAVGVKVNGKQFVKVFVTLKSSVTSDEVTRRVIEICNQNLIRYSVPYFVEVLPQMPRTPFGKIDYKALESRA